jgi:precorrin-2 dehydrogenase
MLPLSLDLTRLDLVLIGTGSACLRRLQLLREAGACSLTVFSAAPSDELTRVAGSDLRLRWPSAKELRAAQLVFIADIAEPQRGALATAARAAGAILHDEDAPALSDSHAPAVLRRGALTIAITTDGAAPGLAVAVRQFLATIIGPEWSERLERVQALRRLWRRDGADHDSVRRLTAAEIARYGWLNHRPLAANDRGDKMSETERGGVS